MPINPTQQADQNRLDQKLLHDILLARSDRHPDADLVGPPVTDTSMIFMTPMPPTISDMTAMPRSSASAWWWSC